MNQDPKPDRELSRQLEAWKVESPLPPGFRAGVWRQIAAEEEAKVSVWSLLSRWLAEMFTLPQTAAVTAMALVLLGAGAGWWQARTEGARMDESLRVRYLQSVNPYQTPRS